MSANHDMGNAVRVRVRENSNDIVDGTMLKINGRRTKFYDIEDYN